MHYAEHAPARELRQYVECYWTLRGVASDRLAHRVLPDGCVDILFDLGAGALANVVGPMTTAVITPPAPVGFSMDLVGVRFRPGEAPAFLAVSAREIRDLDVPLEDASPRWDRDLAPRLRDASVEARIRLLDRALLSRRRAFAADRRLRTALVSLRDGTHVSEVASLTGLGERHLLRLFEEHVGLGPKAFARVIRAQALVSDLDALALGESPRWADLAAAHGFSDQAHLIREVKALTGVSPSALFRERLQGKLGMSERSNPPASLAL